MYRTNRYRRKQLILTSPDLKLLYRLLKVLGATLLLFLILLIFIEQWNQVKHYEIKKQLFGTWDVLFLDISTEDINYFKNHAFIEKYSIQSVCEKVYLEDDIRVVIGSCDRNFFELGNIELLKGKMPKNKNEVAVEEEYLNLLDVRKVGDFIPDDSPVVSLRGYQLCGIISNYSSRWKKMNWNVKYINCFISGAKHSEIDIFVHAEDKILRDIKTNMINYVDNYVYIKKPFIPFVELGFLFSFIFIIVFSIYRCKLKYKLRRVYLNNERHSRNRIFDLRHFIEGKSFTLLCILISLTLSYFFVNRLVYKIHYVSDINISDIYIDREEYDKLKEEYISNYSTKEIKELSNIDIFIIVNFLFPLITIIFINILICVFDICIIEQELNKSKQVYCLKDYYYGSKKFSKKILVLYIFKINLEVLIYYFCFKLSNSDIASNYNNIVSNYFRLIIILIFIILRTMIIYFYIKHELNKITIENVFLLTKKN